MVLCIFSFTVIYIFKILYNSMHELHNLKESNDNYKN